MFIVDQGWDRVFFSSQSFPDSIPHYEMRTYGGSGNGIGEFWLPMGIDATTAPDGEYSEGCGPHGGFHHDIHVFVADYGNSRIHHLLYRRDAQGGQLFTNRLYINRVNLNLFRPVDVTCDPLYWDQWDVIYALTDDSKITAIDLDFEGGANKFRYGEYGSDVGQFSKIQSICVRRTRMVVADTYNNRIVLLKANENSLDWCDTYGFETSSSITNVSIDQWMDVYATDWKNNVVHKLHINDDNGGSLEYITTYGSTGTDEDEFFNLQCAAAGIKETDGHNLSDVLFIEEWSDENGLVGFQVGADVVDFYTYPHKVTPEDEDQIVDIYFKVTGPIHINSMDILDDNARSVGFIWNDQTVNWVADDNYPNSGEKHIVAEFEKGFNIYGNYHFNINYDSWAEKFP